VDGHWDVPSAPVLCGPSCVPPLSSALSHPLLALLSCWASSPPKAVCELRHTNTGRVLLTLCIYRPGLASVRHKPPVPRLFLVDGMCQMFSILWVQCLKLEHGSSSRKKNEVAKKVQ
jgi:hypothetical protein